MAAARCACVCGGGDAEEMRGGVAAGRKAGWFAVEWLTHSQPPHSTRAPLTAKEPYSQQ